MEMYQRHVKLAEEYVRLSEVLKRLKKRWNDTVAQIIAARGLQGWRADEYKKRVGEYCELCAAMVRSVHQLTCVNVLLPLLTNILSSAAALSTKRRTIRELQFIEGANCKQLGRPLPSI